MWLVPSAVVAALAMLWVAWAGRPQREQTERSEAAHERFVRAITREHPTAGRPRPVVPRDRSTGIAVRPSRAAQAAGGRPSPDERTRRSA